MKTLFSSISAVLSALAACTSCIGPLIAFAGFLGVSASQLIWLSSIKTELIAFSLVAISYNLYRAYYPKKVEICCSIEESNSSVPLTKKESKTLLFLQSKPFLWSIAILTLFILLSPKFTTL